MTTQEKIKEVEKEIEEKERESKIFIENLFKNNPEISLELLMKKDKLIIELSGLQATLKTLQSCSEEIMNLQNELTFAKAERDERWKELTDLKFDLRDIFVGEEMTMERDMWKQQAEEKADLQEKK